MLTVAARHGFSIAVALTGAAAIVVSGYLLRHTFVGDAAVYLPYARNAAHGHPFQFNSGEFSSGSTSPLWSLLLGVPYLLGFALTGAKAFSTGFALLGFGAALVAARRLSGSWAAASVAALFTLGTMAFFAVSLYESGLVVLLGALSLIAGERTLRMWREQETIGRASLVPLALVWAALPLARPDAVILVIAEALALVALGPLPRRRTALALLAALAVAALPAIAYFGWSQIDLGTPSTSSQGRAEALREALDPWIGPLYLSGSTVKELFKDPWVFGFVPALAGIALFARRRPTAWLAAYAALATAGYLVLLTFITPGLFFDTPRYLIPLVPFVVAGIARLLAEFRGARLAAAALVAGALMIGATAGDQLRDYTHLARTIGITENEVFERDASTFIGQHAQHGDTVLAYEVQLRLFLRPDLRVLSEDGITDGKVHPYQHDHDMTAFLRRYRPRWWIADNNVHSRPFLRGSVLEQAATSFEQAPDPPVRTIDGIQFELVARRDRPLAPGFGGWTMLFRLSYP